MKTYSVKAGEIERDWYVVDAADQVLGRLATRIATVLRGKAQADLQHAPRHRRLRRRGERGAGAADREQGGSEEYFRHSGYMGGERFIPFRRMLDRHPDRVIKLAVKGMLPKNTLGRQMLGKLRVYAGRSIRTRLSTPAPSTRSRNSDSAHRGLPGRRELAETEQVPVGRTSEEVGVPHHDEAWRGRRERERPGVEEYFTIPRHRSLVAAPLDVTGTRASYDIAVRVRGEESPARRRPRAWASRAPSSRWMKTAGARCGLTAC